MQYNHINYYITYNKKFIYNFFYYNKIVEEFYFCYLNLLKLFRNKYIIENEKKKLIFTYLNSNYIKYSLIEFKHNLKELDNK